MVPPLDLILPILGAVVAGAAIGFEREYHGRPAGLRTHMLVCLAAALLMLAATHQVQWMSPTTPIGVLRIDPTRMAHGILTGVGFLCGGVIFQQKLSVYGLTTAASLWLTSALGVLFGIGLYELAIPGTVIALLVLAPSQWLTRRLPQENILDLAVRVRRDDPLDEAHLRALVHEFGLWGSVVNHRQRDGGAIVELSGSFRGKGVLPIDALAKRLAADPRVVEFDLLPRKD
jgi:putative Mg2+ transporter-C (MgtC) family protein